MKSRGLLMLVVTIVCFLTILAISFSAKADTEHVINTPEFYPRLTIVVDTIYSYTEYAYVIKCEDSHGNLWTFFCDRDIWRIGDIANLFMWNIGTCEEDNAIIEVYYEGHTDNIDLFFQMVSWR